MEKFHQFYLPQGLFKDRPVTVRVTNDDQKVKFATLKLKSNLYKMKQSALGLSSKRRGRKSTGKKTSKKPSDLEENVESDNEEHSESSLSSSTGGKKKKEITTSNKKSKKKGTTKSKKRSTATKQTISDEYVEPDEGYHSDNSWDTYNLERV